MTIHLENSPFYKRKRIILILLYIFFFPYYLSVFGDDNLNFQKYEKVFLILFDALGTDHMSCYGYHRKTTPTIDRLASEGIICINNYTQGLNTFFSVPSIMYSRYFPPMVHESVDTIECIRKKDKDEKMITEILRENGYHTVFFTAHGWFSNDSPLVRTFDEAFLITSQSTLVPTFSDLNRELFTWLERNKDRAFFAYIHLIDTHFPHIINTPFDLWVTEDIKTKIKEERRTELQLGSNERNIFNPLKPEEIEFLSAIYDGSVLYADTQLSLLISKLETLDILDKSLIIICSDHGELLGEDGMLWGHPPISYQALIRTPLIFYGLSLPKGKKIINLTENIDIVPTILDILGIQTEAKFDGTSLLPYFYEKIPSNIGKPYAHTRCFYLEPENYEKIMEIEKGYESPQMFILSNNQFTLEYNEVNGKYYFWSKDTELKYIREKKFCKEKRFPSIDESAEYHLEFHRAKEYLKNQILPKYIKYKKKPIDTYFIPFSTYTIPKYVVNKENLIIHAGNYEKFSNDNKWAFDTDGLTLWAQPWNETISPLHFSFKNIEPGDYCVFVKIACKKDFYGHPLSSIKVNLPDFNNPICITLNGCEELRITYKEVGKVSIKDSGIFNVSIQSCEKNMWCWIGGIALSNEFLTKNPNIESNKENRNNIDVNATIPYDERVKKLKDLGYL